jgi:hypothetical protein
MREHFWLKSLTALLAGSGQNRQPRLPRRPRGPQFRLRAEVLEDRSVPAVIFTQNFDAVTAPALPASWTATNPTGPAPLWTTTSAGANTGPNAAVINNPSTWSVKQLTSPSIALPSADVKLSFQHTFAMEDVLYDGGRLDISVNGGLWSEILNAGGTFLSGGYNGTIRTTAPTGDGGPGWNGTIAGGFGTYGLVEVLLPVAARGQNIQLRWRMTSDITVGGTGWKVDTISIDSVATLRATAGTSQSTTVSSPFPTNLQVMARDQNGVPASGVSVTFTAPGTGASVTFPSGNTALTDMNGLASIPVVANNQSGAYAVTAAATAFASTSFSLSNTQVPTTTTLVSSTNPTGVGQTVTFTATVTPATSGSLSAGGTVSFTFDGVALGDPVPLVGGQATSPATLSAQMFAGSHSVIATYTGDFAFQTSNTTIAQLVDQTATTTTLISSANLAGLGQPATFTATVAPDTAGTFTAGGTVSFTFDGVALGGPVPLVGGMATSTATLPDQMTFGVHTVIATYSGDANFQTSNSTIAQLVGQMATTTTLMSSASPSSQSQEVTFTASVSPTGSSSFTPSGTVTFQDGATGAVLGVAVLAGGSTTFSTSSLGMGLHPITAVYGGDASFQASMSAALPQQVDAGIPLSGTAQVQVDPLLVGKEMLIINGTSGNDTISVKPRGTSTTSFNVIINGGPTLLYENVTGRIKVLGNAGNDRITIGSTVKKQTELNGGSGNDTIVGGSGIDYMTGGFGDDSISGGANSDYLVESGDVNMTLTPTSLAGLGTDNLAAIEKAILTGGNSGNILNASAFKGSVVLVGGGGADSLTGGSGRDLLIGGLGLDSLLGGAGDDILIGGTTSFDSDVAALDSVMKEWTRIDTQGSYAKRIAHLRDGTAGGKNGTVRLNSTTVFDDTTANSLTGGLSRDWFFTGTAPDLVADLNIGGAETVTQVP